MSEEIQILENWKITNNKLLGVIWETGCPMEVITATIVKISDTGLVTTRNGTKYALGAPDADYARGRCLTHVWVCSQM